MKIVKYFVLLIVVLICACRTTLDPHIENVNTRIAESIILSDSLISSIIAPYKTSLDNQMNLVIGELDVELTKEQPESTIGNWLADMLLEESEEIYSGHVDFAIQNHGGVRINSFSPGPITVGEIYEIMPFDNMLFILEANGGKIQILLDHIAKDGGWPVSHTLRFEIEQGKAQKVTIEGLAIDTAKIYTFALPDYIANGGSGSFFLRNYKRTVFNVLIRDAFINQIVKDAKRDLVQHAELDGRIVIVGHE